MPEDKGSQDHIAELEPKKSHEKGCVTKHVPSYKNDRCSYRYQGYQECSGAAKKDIYEIDFTKSTNARRLPYLYQEFKLGSSDKEDPKNWRWADNPIEKKDAWWFKGENFKKGYLPYNHNYHHILPFVSLKKLSYRELNFLQGTGYNLNAGNNMIILPCLAEYGVAMLLPDHPRGHPTYNEEVSKIVNKIKKDVNGGRENHQIKKKDMENFKKKLENWQERQFKAIVNFGKTLSLSSVDENMVDSVPPAKP